MKRNIQIKIIASSNQYKNTDYRPTDSDIKFNSTKIRACVIVYGYHCPKTTYDATDNDRLDGVDRILIQLAGAILTFSHTHAHARTRIHIKPRMQLSFSSKKN